MIGISIHQHSKYLLFGSLYFSQGIIYTIASVYLPIYLIEKNVPIETATIIIGITYLPWVIKFFFGYIVDFFNSYSRKYFIICGGITSSLALLALSIINPEKSLLPFAIFALISSMGIAFLDVSADAWAIQISNEKERGKINAAMFGGLFIGMAVSTSILSQIANTFGYPLIFLVSAFLIIIIITVPIIIKENIVIRKREKIGSKLITEFKKKSTQLIALFSPISAISFGMLAIAIPLYMKISLKLDISQIGLIMTIVPIATVLGNIVGGFTADHWGRKKSLYIFIFLNIIFICGLIFANSWQKLAIIWGIIGFLHGGYYSTLGALLMDATNPKIGAFQYSLFTSFTNSGETGGAAISGTLIAMIGFSRVFLFAGWIYGPALMILYFIRLKKNR